MDTGAVIKKHRVPDYSLLEDIICNKFEYSPFILILDTSTHPSKSLFEFMRTKQNILVVEGNKIESLKLLLSEGVLEENFIHVNDLELELMASSQSKGSFQLEEPSKLTGSPHLKGYSKSMGSFQQILQKLLELSKSMNRLKKSMIVTIQLDFLGEEMVNALKFISTTVIFVGPRGSLTTIHRLPGGKVKKEQSQIEDHHIKAIKEDLIKTINETLPISTFNLSLTEAQAEAKAAVQLPHIRVQKEGISAAPKYAKPVLAEDFDEEDPDDDLDI